MQIVWVLYVVVMTFFSPLKANALSGEELMVLSYCADSKSCAQSSKEYFSYLQLKCETDTKVHSCEELSKENPSWAPLMRKCDKASLCEQNEDYIKNKNLACLRGYKNAAVDLGIALKDMAVGLGGFISSSWDSTKKSIKQRNEFIKECNKSILCKRDLIKDDPRYNKMTDAEIEKLPASFLFVQAEEIKNVLASQKRLSHKNTPPASAQREPEYLDAESTHKKDLLMAMIEKKLGEQYDRYICYNPIAREELKCYALGSVLDPLAVAGYFAKAGRMTAALSRVSKADEPLRRATDAKIMIEEKRVYTGATQVIIAKPQILKVTPPKSLGTVPDLLKVDKVRQVDGSEYLRYSFAEKLEDGRWVKNQKELPIDNLTGAINANFTTGREFFAKMVEAKAGKSHLAFIDVGSLGAVNNEFKGGVASGDRYIKAVAEEIMKHGEGKITLARLGGDEFGILIDSKDPQEVQRILRNIQDGIRKDLSGPAHQVFREEKIARAEEYREHAKNIASQRPDGTLTASDKQALREDIDELAKIQQPDISIGTTQVGSRDDLSGLLEQAENQAKAMKTETVLNFGRSAEKYGSDAHPRAKPNPRYQGEVRQPLTSDSWTSANKIPSPADIEKLTPMKIQRQEEISRFGATTLARYEDELGRSSYRVEKYFTDPAGLKQRISSEIPTRGNTGLLDGLHPESQNLILGHLKSSSDTALLMPKLKSLRYLNYFESGTKAGDQMLEAVAKAIKNNTRSEDLSFKLSGSDFLVSIKHADPSGISRISEKVRQDLQKSPEVKAILDNEKKTLTEKLKAAEKKNDSSSVTRLRKKLDDLKNFDPGLDFQAISVKDVKSDASFEQIVKTLDKKFSP